MSLRRRRRIGDAKSRGNCKARRLSHIRNTTTSFQKSRLFHRFILEHHNCVNPNFPHSIFSQKKIWRKESFFSSVWSNLIYCTGLSLSFLHTLLLRRVFPALLSSLSRNRREGREWRTDKEKNLSLTPFPSVFFLYQMFFPSLFFFYFQDIGEEGEK